MSHPIPSFEVIENNAEVKNRDNMKEADVGEYSLILEKNIVEKE